MDEEVLRAAYLKEFHAYYGEGADAVALYRVQPVWIRFAAAFPRMAFLMDSLWAIYNDIENAIHDFNQLLTTFDPEGSWQKLGMGYDPTPDAFAFFFNMAMEGQERMCLLQLRWALHNSRGGRLDFLLRECARGLRNTAKSDERKLILDELLASDGDAAVAIASCGPGKKEGFWGVRKRIVARERTLCDALDRIQEALDSNVVIQQRAQKPVHHDQEEPESNDFAYQYGNGSIPEARSAGRVARFARSPTRSRSRSPLWHPDQSEDFVLPFRSLSRDSVRSSVHPGSSVTTYAPEAPEDRFSVSVRVFSAANDGWVESIANYDTGCDAGNFISSSFVEDHLNMGDAIEEDPDAQSLRVMDIGGNTTFKPRGRIRLSWIGRNLHKGRKGKRSEEFTGWFYVAPRPPADHAAEPFQILLGKEFIDENEVFTYRGFRLFRVKKHHSQQDSLELERRDRLREEMEDERRNERQTSDAASVMTRTSGSSSSLLPASSSPQSSSQGLANSPVAVNGGGIGHVVT